MFALITNVKKATKQESFKRAFWSLVVMTFVYMVATGHIPFADVNPY